MGSIDESILQSISALAETQILANPMMSGANGANLQNQGNLLGGIAIWLGRFDLWYKERTWISFSNNFFFFKLKEKTAFINIVDLKWFPFKSEDNICEQKGCNSP